MAVNKQPGKLWGSQEICSNIYKVVFTSNELKVRCLQFVLALGIVWHHVPR